MLGHDLVVDCSDSFDDALRRQRAPAARPGVRWSRAACVGLTGLVMAIRPGETRVLPLRLPGGAGRTRRPAPTAGVLGPAAGVIGSLMALEALKLLAGLAGALLDAFLQVDLAAGDVPARGDGAPGRTAPTAASVVPECSAWSPTSCATCAPPATATPPPAASPRPGILLTWPGVHALVAHRVAHRLDDVGVPVVPRVIAARRPRADRRRDPPGRLRRRRACSSTTARAS